MQLLTSSCFVGSGGLFASPFDRHSGIVFPGMVGLSGASNRAHRPYATGAVAAANQAFLPSAGLSESCGALRLCAVAHLFPLGD
jgi:hypothetical protein